MQINLLYQPSSTVAQVWLAANESVTAESGAMMGTSTNVAMQTQAGGMMGGIKRMFGGESFFRNTFVAQGGPGEVLLAPPLAGDLAIVEAGHKQWFIQNSSYVASANTVDVATRLDGFRGFFSGAGLFVLGTQGFGPVVIGSYGAMEAIEVDGELLVDTGHLCAWESTLNYELVKSGTGWIASYFSGEGFLCHFRGKGTVYVGTRNPNEFGGTVGPMLAPRQG